MTFGIGLRVTLSKPFPFFLSKKPQKEAKTANWVFRAAARLGALPQDPATFLKKGRSKTFKRRLPSLFG
ncbi:MAG: hypothetical protein IIX86_08855 [Clostridia bacterium]|nr:hypothetical protein [Clostridia bacterium]